MKNITLAILLIILTTGITFSQGRPVGAINEIKNIAPDGSNNYAPQPISQELSELTKKVKQAKRSGNLAEIKFYQDKIDALTGSAEINTISIQPNVIARAGDGNQNDNYSYTVLNSTHSIISGAVATDRITGMLYAAYTRPIEGASDEMYIYKSSNNGIGWTLLSLFTLPSLGDVNYRPNEIDLEVVNNGDTSFVYCVAGLNYGSTVTSMLYRCRQDGNFDGVRILESGTPGNKARFPRITSDNASYDSGSFIYIVYTLDSTVGSQKSLRSKFILCPNPFASTLQFNIKSNSSVGAYFYYADLQPDSSFMQSDVAYVNTPGDTDIIVTTTVVRGASTLSGNSVFMTHSLNYGNTLSATYNYAGSNLIESPRIASPGYLNRNVMITVRRLYGGGDWDAYYYYSNNLTPSTGNFNQNGYVSTGTDTTMTVNLTARYRSFDNFLVAFSTKTPGIGTGRAYVGAREFKAGVFRAPYFINGVGGAGTSLYGAPMPTFRFVNNDSCLVGWGNASGIGYNITGGSGGSVTGTGNNSTIAKDFLLSQNYPNPFNPSTKISFNVKQNSLVKLTVYDALGKETAILVNEQISAGEHSIEFNALGLTSGVYYYKLEANGFSDVKKMMLIK